MRGLIAGCLLLAGCVPNTSPSAQIQPSVPLASATVAGTVIAGRAVAFERIGPTPPGGNPVSGRTTSKPTILVAATAEEYASLFANDRLATTVAGTPALPEGASYIAAFAGAKASRSYTITIVDVRAMSNGLVLWTRQAGPGDTILPLVTYPVDVVRVNASELSRGTVLEQRDATGGSLLARVVYCGSTRKVTPLTPYDPVGPECVWSAYSRGDSAQWLMRSLTVEGGPVIRTLRAIPGSLSEASLDSRGDFTSTRRELRSYACTQVARSTAYLESGGTVAWFSLSACSGDGVQIDVG